MQELFLRKRTSTYNCADFAIEAAATLFQKDISETLRSLTGRAPRAEYKSRRGFVKDNTITTGLILFRNKPDSPHVGVLLGGKVLHLGRRSVQYVDKEILMIEFQSYTCYKVLS